MPCLNLWIVCRMLSTKLAQTLLAFSQIVVPLAFAHRAANSGHSRYTTDPRELALGRYVLSTSRNVLSFSTAAKLRSSTEKTKRPYLKPGLVGLMKLTLPGTWEIMRVRRGKKGPCATAFPRYALRT